MDPRISGAGHDVIQVGMLSVRYFIDGSATGGMGAFELTIPSNATVPPPHSHSRNDEWIYGLDGALRYSVDDVERDLKPGDWMFSPRGSVHKFSNPHQQPARALIVMTPDLGAQYFKDVAELVSSGPPDRARLAHVMTKYGLVLAAPKTT